MKIAIIILARAKYCKRIKNKPLVMFHGKSLIEHTLEFAEKLEYDTYVYSDMQEMKDICNKYNVNYREKQLEHKDGNHKTADELKIYNKEIKADIIILLQVTSPLRNLEKIKGWIKNFIENDYDVGFTVNKFNKFVYDEKGNLINFKDRGYVKKINNYTENGSFYIFKIKQIEKEHITDANNKMLFVDDYDLDIDTYEDLENAEIKYRRFCEN